MLSSKIVKLKYMQVTGEEITILKIQWLWIFFCVKVSCTTSVYQKIPELNLSPSHLHVFAPCLKKISSTYRIPVYSRPVDLCPQKNGICPVFQATLKFPLEPQDLQTNDLQVFYLCKIKNLVFQSLFIPSAISISKMGYIGQLFKNFERNCLEFGISSLLRVLNHHAKAVNKGHIMFIRFSDGFSYFFFKELSEIQYSKFAMGV